MIDYPWIDTAPVTRASRADLGQINATCTLCGTSSGDAPEQYVEDWTHEHAEQCQPKHPPHPVPRADRRGTHCEDYELNGCFVNTCPDGCYLAQAEPMTSDAGAIPNHRPLITRIVHYARCQFRPNPPGSKTGADLT